MLKNNLISLLDTTFPGRKSLVYQSAPRRWQREVGDFVATFWHCECVCGRSEKAFTTQYQKWCRKHGYNFSEDKALDIFASCLQTLRCHTENGYGKTFGRTGHFSTPDNFFRVSCSQTGDAIPGSFSAGVSCSDGMFGVGPTLGPQLLAEIGDVRRFHSKKALVAFAGIDAPPYQSGQIDVRSRSISKRGSASLRRTLFLVMSVILQCAPIDEPVYQFMDKKRSEGKPYRVYMMALCHQVPAHLLRFCERPTWESLEHD